MTTPSIMSCEESFEDALYDKRKEVEEHFAVPPHHHLKYA